MTKDVESCGNSSRCAMRCWFKAHDGLRDWILQRWTAVFMLVFTFVLFGQLIFFQGPLGYVKWASIFAAPWMKGLTVLAWLAWLYHAWVGIRDVFVDYIKPVWVRRLLYGLSLVWLFGCLVWAIQVLGKL
jgi:succinate dehydrogenase / fumarate reductase membrane anchor subunit